MNDNPDPSENFPPPLTAQFHERVFHGYGYGETRPREPSLRKSFHVSDFKHGRIFSGTIRRDNLRGRITSVLLYILVPVPVKYLPMELRELHTRGRGWGRVSPVPVKFPAHGTGGLDVMQGHMILMAQLQPPLHVTCTAGEQ